jgi:hypothetical protein
MITCLFGRTPDGATDKIPAVKLHRELATRGVFLDLVARTESIQNPDNSSRVTISPMREKIIESTGRKPQTIDFKGKRRFTKILCTFRNDAPVVLLKPYSKREEDIDSETLEGRRLLWADNVVNEIVKFITVTGGEINDARHQTLYDFAIWFDSANDPVGLKRKLDSVVAEPDVMWINVDRAKNFTVDRGIGMLNPWSVPKTAIFVRQLLRTYPHR